jgi:diaminohydroxyphosphoribosylaminopyrimidine deaminase/5-amino-6-(5-phosphoribosylamino)uracil reductase
MRDALEARGAAIEVVDDGALRPALHRLAEREIGSLLLEGGATLHAAAWDEGVIDYVRLYITPHVLGAAGVALLPDRSFASTDLQHRRVEALGPDVLIEGYVHRPG